jgi:hypothetical protein
MVYSTTLTPTERTLRSRLAAHTQHAAHDPRQTTQKARETFLKRFEKEVDPDGILPPEVRARRAEHAKRAYFCRLALRSVQARRKAKEARNGHAT